MPIYYICTTVILKKVDASVAERLAFDCKVQLKVGRQDMCIYGHQVGRNISIKGDGHVGGQLFLTEKGRGPRKKPSTINNRKIYQDMTPCTYRNSCHTGSTYE